MFQVMPRENILIRFTDFFSSFVKEQLSLTHKPPRIRARKKNCFENWKKLLWKISPQSPLKKRLQQRWSWVNCANLVRKKIIEHLGTFTCSEIYSRRKSAKNTDKSTRVVFLIMVLVKSLINQSSPLIMLFNFIPLISFYIPRKHQKTRAFLMFSGCLEVGQWHETR